MGQIDWIEFFAVGGIVMFCGYYAVVIIYAVITTARDYRRAKRRLASRPSMSKKDFAAYFSRESVPARVSEAVWAALERRYSKGHAPHPGDALAADGILSDNDWDAVMHDIARKLRAKPASGAFDLSPVHTVADLVRFCAAELSK